MSNIFEVDGSTIVSRAADKLKEMKLEKPAYIDFVKSGPSRERLPASSDFWYFRCASVLRQVYVNGPVGVSRLRTRYGGNKAHKVSKHHHRRAGGSIIRDAFASLEKVGLIKKTSKGRVISNAGRSFLDKIAKETSRAG
jgi:small subunit ribosomal protein S19e